MAVELIEIDQVDEDQPAIDRVHCVDRLVHTVGITLGLLVFANAAAQEHVENLAHAVDVDAAAGELVKQHPLGRRHGVIVPIRRACECTR